MRAFPRLLTPPQADLQATRAGFNLSSASILLPLDKNGAIEYMDVSCLGISL